MTDNTCTICYNDVCDKGAIDCCSHPFCDSCILKWAETENSCPLCRKKFNIITTKNKIIEVEDKRQQVSDEEYSFVDEDFVDEVIVTSGRGVINYMGASSIENIYPMRRVLSSCDIGTIVKKRNTNIKNRFKYVVYKRYFMTEDFINNDMRETGLQYVSFIQEYGKQNTDNPMIFDVYFGNFDIPRQILWEDALGGTPFGNLLWDNANNHHIQYNQRGTGWLSPLHYIEEHRYSLSRDWMMGRSPIDNHPMWAIYCPDVAYNLYRKNIIQFVTKRELKYRNKSIEKINNIFSNNNFQKRFIINNKDMGHFQRQVN